MGTGSIIQRFTVFNNFTLEHPGEGKRQSVDEYSNDSDPGGTLGRYIHGKSLSEEASEYPQMFGTALPGRIPEVLSDKWEESTTWFEGTLAVIMEAEHGIEQLW